jgi:hypothetical protein
VAFCDSEAEIEKIRAENADRIVKLKPADRKKVARILSVE